MQTRPLIHAAVSRLLVCVAALALTSDPGAGRGLGVPPVIAFQGYLTDDDGAAVDGVVTLDVALYDVGEGGVASWAESHPDVAVMEGIFTIALGSQVALADSLFDAASLWLGVSVNGEEELPRTPLRTTPFAFRARNADRVGGVAAGELVRAGGDTLSGPLRLEGGVEALAPGGGVTEVVASTTDVLLRRFFFSGTADSWDGTHARLVLVVNGSGPPGVGGAGTATIVRNQIPIATLAIEPSGSRPSTYLVNLDVEDGTSLDVAIRAASGTAPVFVRSLFLETVEVEGQAVEVSLDDAYDAGGSGGGRAIVADAGAVAIEGPGGLEVTGPLVALGAAADSAVVLPDSSVSSAERLDEPGIVRSRAPGNREITDSFVEMVDVAVVTITLPAPGYVHLTGVAQARFSASTTGNVMAVQIDETSGGPIDVSHYFFVGYETTSPAGETYVPVTITRTYLKPAGTFTFRLEAMDHDDQGAKGLWNASLTATYHPTAYGTVTTLAPPGSGGEPVWIEGQGGPSGGAEIIDLRETPGRRAR